MLCVDEKSQIQALDRTQPILPMLPGHARAPHARLRAPRHDEPVRRARRRQRQGHRRAARRHRAIEFKRFLQTIDAEVPAELDVHLVLDNYATHKTPAIRRWLAAHPRFHLHFTPTGASWLNLVERWFAELTAQQAQARRASLACASSNADIRDWLGTGTTNPAPTSGPRPPTRSSTHSPHTANELLRQDTSGASSWHA